MKVLLLGATGLLGHNVLLRLMEEGHQVVALVRRADGIHLPQGTWETVVGSLLDYNTLEKAAERLRCHRQLCRYYGYVVAQVCRLSSREQRPVREVGDVDERPWNQCLGACIDGQYHRLWE